MLAKGKYEDQPLTLVEVPEEYYPKRFKPGKECFHILEIIKNYFPPGEPVPWEEIEKKCNMYKPFLLKRWVATLWAHGYLKKYVVGKWSGARRNKHQRRGMYDSRVGQRTPRVGLYYGVHYEY